MRIPSPFTRRRERSRGQSLVEFALALPVLLLLTLAAIDFGRVYLGWVNLQQMTRIAADQAAANASAWGTPGDAAEHARYERNVLNDARAINCDLPDGNGDGNPDIPPPQVVGLALGSHVRVAIDCQFSVITPIISQIMGGTILLSAETTYPVTEGAVAIVPGGGSPIVTPPDADFLASPQTGWSPLEVTFTDLSTGGPAAWTWDFSVGGTTTGGGVADVDIGSALSRGPHDVTYSCAGPAGATCTFGVSLRVSNSGGDDTRTRSDYITVTVRPDVGPIAEFSGSPRSGDAPLSVDFQFEDVQTPAVTYTTWEWDLDGNGTFESTGQTPSWTYPTPGVYDVSLRVTDSAGATNSVTKVGYINALRPICVVPDFARVNRNQAQSVWSAQGFTTTVQYAAGNWNGRIRTQSIVGGTIDPQPDGCDSIITVGP
jgi:PKD repeat protein